VPDRRFGSELYQLILKVVKILYGLMVGYTGENFLRSNGRVHSVVTSN
jgi:hypothetical protein